MPALKLQPFHYVLRALAAFSSAIIIHKGILSENEQAILQTIYFLKEHLAGWLSDRMLFCIRLLAQ